VYLPPGRWIDYQTSRTYAGGWQRIEAARLPVVMLVRSGAVLPHIALAPSTARMDWSALELVVFGEAAEAHGLVCLPADGVLHPVTVARRGRTLALAGDPLAGRVKWTVRGPGVPGG
jgi:alpha-D-xyloside xylohydrolase